MLFLGQLPKAEAYHLILDDKAFDFSGGTKSLGNAISEPKIDDLCHVLGWKTAINLSYLKERGFANSSIRLWEIEYSEVIRHVRIPIKDEGDTLRGFLFRTIDDLKPKYLYSKGLAKKKILFGMNNFESFKDTANLVEGALDCVWMHQCGFTNTLSILGSDLSSEQCQLLGSVNVGRVNLCLDNDYAGTASTKKISERLVNLGFECRSLVYPNGAKDVQEMDFKELVIAIRRM